MKYVIVVVVIAAAMAWFVVDQRRLLFYEIAKLDGGAVPALMDATQELPTTTWFDDYYTIDEIAPGTYAIGEPRYYQQNYNYLLVGEHTALLFDAGPGVRDIRAVVESLTDLPVIFLASHFHYDHVGNGVDFARRAIVDLPYLRDRALGDRLAFTDMEHLGPLEGFAVPTWQIDHWWAPGEMVELGGRSIQVLHTPGHAPESISIYDGANNIVLSGDFLYAGPLYVFVPGSSVQDYLTTTRTLLQQLDSAPVFYGAHRTRAPGPPLLKTADLIDLENALLAMREGTLKGEGAWPQTFLVNEQISILGDPRFLQDWK